MLRAGISERSGPLKRVLCNALLLFLLLVVFLCLEQLLFFYKSLQQVSFSVEHSVREFFFQDGLGQKLLDFLH